VALNPLWANRGGRTYGDEATAAVSARIAFPLGSRVAVGLAGRGMGFRATGRVPRRRDGTVEAAYVRGTFGGLAIQVGRDAWWRGVGPAGGLLLSADAPPLNLLRFSTDRPLHLRVLGETEIAVTAADLGPSQNFPHAKLFAVTITGRPNSTVRLGVTLLNKQGGDGAPPAGRIERLKDLTFVWGLFRRGRDYTFSEKLLGLDVRFSVPDARGLQAFAEMTITDFVETRLDDEMCQTK